MTHHDALKRCCIQRGDRRWHDDSRFWMRTPFQSGGRACASTGEILLSLPLEPGQQLKAPPGRVDTVAEVVAAGKPILAPLSVPAERFRAFIEEGHIEIAWTLCEACKGSGDGGRCQTCIGDDDPHCSDCDGTGDLACEECDGDGGHGGWDSLVYRGAIILGEFFNLNLICRACLPLLTRGATVALGYVEPERPVCVNPEAIGNPALTPVVQMPRQPQDLRALYIDGRDWRAVVMPMNPRVFTAEDRAAFRAFAVSP